MSTEDLLLGAAALALVLVLGLYFSLTILQSWRAEAADTKPVGSGQESVPRSASTSSPRPTATRAGASSRTTSRSGARGGSDPGAADLQGSDPAASGTWDLYAHSSAQWREPVTYRVRSTGQGAPKWNPYAEEQSRAHRARARRHRQAPLPRIDDHYALLGLNQDATLEEIERAYRRHAALIHPDRFFDDPVRRAEAERKLKQLNAVMEVLRDPLRRAKYDARLSRRQMGPMGEG